MENCFSIFNGFLFFLCVASNCLMIDWLIFTLNQVFKLAQITNILILFLNINILNWKFLFYILQTLKQKLLYTILLILNRRHLIKRNIIHRIKIFGLVICENFLIQNFIEIRIEINCHFIENNILGNARSAVCYQFVSVVLLSVKLYELCCYWWVRRCLYFNFLHFIFFEEPFFVLRFQLWLYLVFFTSEGLLIVTVHLLKYI